MAVFRSNKGMETVCSRAGGLVNFVGGVEHGLLFEQGAGHRQQAIGDGAQGAAVAVAALAQRDMRSSRPQGGSGRDVLARSVPQPARNVMGDRAHPGGAGARLAHPPTGTKSYTPTPCTMRNLHGPSASPCT